MASDNESGADDIILGHETYFIPRSDDEEVLWEVQEITRERGKKFRVKWAGTDPATGKPWAQSWVAKHDVTDDLVLEWRAKQKRAAGRKKRGGRTSTASRTSGPPKRGGSSTSKKTRPSTSEATPSRLDSVQEHISPPPRRSTVKRKRDSETPATTLSSAGRAGEQNEPSRPHKKQKIVLETLLPPITSDESEDSDSGDLRELHARVKAAPQNKAPLKRTGALLDSTKEDDTCSLPKAKGKSARTKGGAVDSRAPDSRDAPKLRGSQLKAKVVLRRKKHIVVETKSAEPSEDEESPLRKSGQMSSSKRSSRSDRGDDDEVAPVTLPMKIGPPRGVKRVEASGSSGRLGSPHTKSREDDSADKRTPTEESEGRPDNEDSAFGRPSLLQEGMVDGPTSTRQLPPLHVSVPQTFPSTRPRSADLSPGTRARLELFDRMVDTPQTDVAPPSADLFEQMPDDHHFDYNDTPDTHDALDAFDPPLPPSPPPSESKPKRPKPSTPNGLIVPETQSSGNSRGQFQPSPRLPPPQPPPVRKSLREPLDLPAIAVIAASATSSSVSPQDLFLLPPKRPPSTNGPSKRKRSTVKPVPQISPNTFRATIKACSQVADSEAPPSSIESFASPRRVDKGKQKAVEDDQLQGSLSEGGEDGECRKEPIQKRVTDSGLKKRGKELFHQTLLTREAERQETKKPKRLKPVRDIVNRTVPSPSKGSPLPFTSGAEDTLEMRWEEIIDLTGGANSTTLDTAEHSEKKTPSEEERERLRMELRQEEEENTQEAMGICPPPPVNESKGVNGGFTLFPPPRSPERSLLSGPIEDVDHVDQPSADIQLASVIVQPSQGRHEDTDIEPLSNQPTSSPPRLIPENLTDSPKRRLGEALSLLNVKSEEIQRLERELADAHKNIQNLKVELTETQQSSEPTGPVRAAWEAERAQWNQERSKWENDFAVWETQRKEWGDEKATLSVRMAELSDATARAEEVRVKLSELEAERVIWTKERDGLLNDITQRTEELAVLTKARGEDDQNRLEWQAEKASWAEEKARWETERAALQEKQEISSHSIGELTASVESLVSAKVSAEKDRDFFREQYTQASAFVSSVRDENTELEKRVKIAEGQAQEGVLAIKTFYEGRFKALEADVDRWKGLSELLQEKDRRTNDELRLRAALVPELRDLCGRLTTENESLEADVRKVGLAQQRSVAQRNKLYYEIIMLKKERASLKSKVSKLTQVANGSTRETSRSAPAPPVPRDPESLDPNDMDMLPEPAPGSSDNSFDELALFPCMWRPQWRDQCQHTFDSKEDLERHVQEHFLTC